MISALGVGVAERPAHPHPDLRLLRSAGRTVQRAAFSRSLDGLVLDRPTPPADPATTAPLLRGVFAARPHLVDLAIDAALREAAFTQLTHGWTVADLRGFARPRIDAQAVRYLVDVFGSTAQWCAASEWFPELDDIGGGIWWTVGESHVAQWARRHDLGRARMLAIAVEVLALLISLPCTLEARPETPEAPDLGAGMAVVGGRLVARIDALFAKAARSVFPEEAAAYAAKAQDLLVRHSRWTVEVLVTPVRRPRPGPPRALRSA